MTNSSDASIQRQLADRSFALSTLFDFSQNLNSTLDLSVILDSILFTSMGKMAVGRGLIVLHYENDIFKIEKCKGSHSKELSGKTFNFSNTFSEALLVEQANLKGDWQKLVQSAKIELILPFTAKENVIGFLGLGKKLIGGKYTSEEIQLLNSIANIASNSIQNAIMYRELKQLNLDLDLTIQELNLLFGISKKLNSALDTNVIMKTLATTVIEHLQLQRCAILHRFDGKINIGYTIGMDDTDWNLLKDDVISESLFSNHNIICIGEMESSLKDVMKNWDINIIIPMILNNEIRGVMLLKQAKFIEIPSSKWTFMRIIANQSIVSLENARLYEEVLEKKRMEEEIAVAKEIQRSLLPSRYPKSENFEFVAVSYPAREVGGDYYDFIELDNNRIGIAIGDVSGKGVPASLLMASVQACLRTLLLSNSPLTEVIRELNSYMYKFTASNKFVTFFFGLLDDSAKKLYYVNAGHNPPLLLHNDGSIEKLGIGGLLIGLFADAMYSQGEIDIASGDVLFFFTDGVNEALNKEEEEFGDNRLEKLLQTHHSENARAIGEMIYSAVIDFTDGAPQSDDLTFVVVKAKK